MRQCVVCGERAPKRGLSRIVATTNGAIEIDPSGKLPGRGAYVHAGPGCVGKTLHRDRLTYALRTQVSSDDLDRVVTSIKATAGAD